MAVLIILSANYVILTNNFFTAQLNEITSDHILIMICGFFFALYIPNLYSFS